MVTYIFVWFVVALVVYLSCRIVYLKERATVAENKVKELEALLNACEDLRAGKHRR